jgi:DNA-binding CsgD family transcriptional regulator
LPVAQDPIALLRLAADVAKAGRDPAAWPGVFEQVATLLDCSAIFGSHIFGVTQSPADHAAVARLMTTNAVRCAESLDRCDARKRQICLALAQHLESALDVGGNPVEVGNRLLGSLDAIPHPLFVVRRNGQLLHTNAAGWQELLDGNWLAQEEGCLCLMPKKSRDSLRGYLADMADAPSPGRDRLKLSSAERGEAELWIRSLGADEHEDQYFLLSLVWHAAQSRPAASPPRHGMTPRQRELARHLMSGHNLSEAAKRMGIERRTAKDHLSALFQHSRTRRQTELVAWLTRQELA